MEHTLFHYQYWAEGRFEMEQSIGRRLQPENVSDFILGPKQELLPDDMSRMQRIKALAEKQRLAFDRMVETILRQKKAAAHQAGYKWTGRVDVVLFCGPKASFSGWLEAPTYV